MTTSYVLDTNIVVLLARGSQLGQRIATEYGLLNPSVRPLISIVSHGELRVLARRNAWGGKKLEFLRELLADGVVTVEISEPVISAYVELDCISRAHQGGAIKMGKNDLWIAATARAAGATLLTTDKGIDHFDPSVLSVRCIAPPS